MGTVTATLQVLTAMVICSILPRNERKNRRIMAHSPLAAFPVVGTDDGRRMLRRLEGKVHPGTKPRNTH